MEADPSYGQCALNRRRSIGRRRYRVLRAPEQLPEALLQVVTMMLPQ